MQKTIIGLSGKRGRGKDTVAKILVEEYGFKRVALADALKDFCSELFGIRLKYFHDPNLKEIELLDFPIREKEVTDEVAVALRAIFKPDRYWTPRQILIATGNFFRAFDPQFWVKRAELKEGDAPRIVYTDVRYNVEYHRFRSRGAKIFRIERPLLMTPYKEDLNNASETELDNAEFHEHVCNDSTVEDLRSTLANLASKYNFK